MIRMIQSTSAAHAKAYFKDELSRSDYYVTDQELQGVIHGRLAERMGITGQVTKDLFDKLCDNNHPVTGQPLTPRTKDDRTVGYDINFHCPKSVSILHVLSKDGHILTAFEKSVRATMQDMERDSKTRVRTKGQDYDRSTGELLWVDFTHQTARPVDGSMPDPHLHAHCFVFNATWDAEEDRIKAGQFRDIKRDMPYYQARFHKRLADELIKLGYEVRLTKNSFEVKGVPRHVIELFSKRTDEIGRAAREKGITSAKELDELGARTRSAKQKVHSMDDLNVEWVRQIHEQSAREGRTENSVVRFAKQKDEQILTPEICVDYALKHGFERASVLQDRRLLASAYRYATGHTEVTLDTITQNFEQDARLIYVQEKGRLMTTTKEVLAEEERMVRLARQGQGKLRPLYSQLPEIKLKGEQRNAIEHVLSTTDRVSIVTGKAGTGKTTTLQELVPLIEKAGKTVTIVAPSADASRGMLRQEGFTQADTIAKLQQDKEMQANLLGQVLIVEEAGMLGTRNMTSLLELATYQNARLILVGDTRQHASVDRGDALRILNTVGGIKTAEISQVYRQQNARYKEAVEDLSVGDVQSAFEKLHEMGAIKEIDRMKPYEGLANDYIETVKNKKSVLVISPTHKQSDETTEAIRKKMRAAGMLGKKELEVSRLQNLNLTEAQKADWRNLHEGHVIQFNQNRPSIKRGSQWTIKNSSAKGVEIQNEESTSVLLPLDKSRDFEVYEKNKILLSKNDVVKITKNGFDEQKNRLNNGQMMEVIRVSKNGKVQLRNVISNAEYELDKDYGHLTHAYCITSHASQGKTVDEVLIAQPASTFPATSSKQFYVSVSRGRERVRIYTDDKKELMEHASRIGDRQSAIELVGNRNKGNTIIQQQIRDKMNKDMPKDIQKTTIKQVKKQTPDKDKTYEPGL
ncbi:MobF family relaxase [Emticicia fluvialis]|uniref:MobF family relaxase n=1 Tax=Emticicia fluvialis TaxID=2974474 RepID=UPI0021653023|nr:MobF family relaxase [Emticicia fluvialis]